MAIEVEKDLYKMEYRSILDNRVDELAKSFGGGGHKNASGSTNKLSDLKDIELKVNKIVIL